MTKVLHLYDLRHQKAQDGQAALPQARNTLIGKKAAFSGGGIARYFPCDLFPKELRRRYDQKDRGDSGRCFCPLKTHSSS